MFAEASFDEAEATNPPHPRETPGRAPPTQHANVFKTPPTMTVSFHKPGDAGFCAVAGAGEDAEALLDARTISGDTWVDDTCRCLRCECLRVMQSLDLLNGRRQKSKRLRGTPLILLLLDLDNFGFNQFKSVPPGSSAAANEDDDGIDEDHDGTLVVNPLRHLFVWAFFGSCFTRYHRAWPTAESVCEVLPSSSRSASSSLPKRRTIWQRLVGMGHVHFTPCAGQSQAADRVMMLALDVFAERDVILLTGDTRLIAEVQKRRRRPGQKSRRDNEKDMVSDRLTLIDVNDNDKRFVPVWRDLERHVHELVHDARSRSVEAQYGEGEEEGM